MARLTVDMDTIDLRDADDVVRGRHVDNLQGLLKATRVPQWDPGAVDGLGGARTRESVRAFQVSNQLAPDMIVGPLTWGRLIPYYEPTCVRPGVAAPGPGKMAVLVFFTCAQDGDESPPVALSRVVPQSPAVLRTALDQLLAGPDQAERAAGFSSWFSDATAGMVNSVALEPNGRAIVDLGDLRPIIPGASSSAGSRLLLSQLDATVFQFPSVRSVRYQLNGSCDAFFEWLQAECHDRPRSGGLT